MTFVRPSHLVRTACLASCTGALLLLISCGNGSDTSSSSSNTSNNGNTSNTPASNAPQADASELPATPIDAVRLANQASFGATEALVAQIAAVGTKTWITQQFAVPASRYHTALYGLNPDGSPACLQGDDAAKSRCHYLADWPSAVGDEFFDQAIHGEDQLRQRVAYALAQVLVIGNLGNAMATNNYEQMLRDNAFANYRDILRSVTLSPAMGAWLNLAYSHADNVWGAPGAPNENYARELMELFSIGKCNLEPDGSLTDDKCVSPYDPTATVTEYARALTGWAYVEDPQSFFKYNMAPKAGWHDTRSITLLSGVTIPAGSTAESALESVLDSLMKHKNMAPFIGQSMIRFLVTSNPTPAYIKRVSEAFSSGVSHGIGSGQAGDMKAVVAAVLLDDEARNLATSKGASYGRLREGTTASIAAIRAFKGTGATGMNKAGYGPFESVTVFNYFPAVFPVGGLSTANGSFVNGPEFGAVTPDTNMARVNRLNDLIFKNPYGLNLGGMDYSPFYDDAEKNPRGLVDRLDFTMTGGRLGSAQKDDIAEAMQQWTAADTDGSPAFGYDNVGSNWRRERVRMAAFLIMSSPEFQVQR